MVFQAALTAAQPNSSLKPPSKAISAGETRWYGCHSVDSKPYLAEDVAGLCESATGGTFRRRNRPDDFGAYGHSPFVSRLLLRFTLRGQTGALRLGVVLLRLRRPCGVSVPPRKSLKAAAKNAAQTFSGSRQESTPWHLGAGPTRSLRER